jgi:hypothetical protein
METHITVFGREKHEKYTNYFNSDLAMLSDLL